MRGTVLSIDLYPLFFSASILLAPHTSPWPSRAPRNGEGEDHDSGAREEGVGDSEGEEDGEGFIVAFGTADCLDPGRLDLLDGLAAGFGEPRS